MGLEKIIEYKKKLGLTTEELSQRSGVPIGTLNKILSGATKDPKLETLKAIARVLGLTLNDFDDKQDGNTPVDLYTDVSYSMMNTLLARNGKKLTKDEKMALITILSSPDEPEDHDPKKQDRVPDLRKTEDGYVMGTKRVDEKQ